MKVLLLTLILTFASPVLAHDTEWGLIDWLDFDPKIRSAKFEKECLNVFYQEGKEEYARCWGCLYFATPGEMNCESREAKIFWDYEMDECQDLRTRVLDQAALAVEHYRCDELKRPE
jgi:hypothetical protein